MESKLPQVLSNNVLLGLDKQSFDQYQSFDEKQDLYAEIKKAAAASSWMQADFFKYLWEETNEKTLNKFASSVNESPGTVNNYIRTAKAFTQTERNPMLTFSHHFQASLADSYDSKQKQFQGKTRFKWLQKAIDDNMTTRQLNEEIMRGKKQKELGTITCTYCHKDTDDIHRYNFYNVHNKHSDHLNFHDICYQQVLAYVNQKR